MKYKFVFYTDLDNYYGEVLGVTLEDGRSGLLLDSWGSTKIKVIPDEAFKSLLSVSGTNLSEHHQDKWYSADQHTEII